MIPDEIPITLVVEDDVSDAVARKILAESVKKYAIGHTYGRTGSGYIKSRIAGFNRAARSTPFLILTDLDRAECPPVLVRGWLAQDVRHRNLLFRVAVREIEAWLLAHREAFAAFAGIRRSMIPENVEEIADAKKCLITLVSKSARRALRDDIVPPLHGSRQQGPNYNGRLAAFVYGDWDPRVAKRRSNSLARTLEALDNFSPSWTSE